MSGRRIATLDDFNNASPRPDSGRGEVSDSDGPAQPQRYFTGGERSGQFVEDPSGGDNDFRARQLVQDLLHKAALGGMPHEAEDENGDPVSSQPRFSGAGYRLGSDVISSTVIPDPNLADAPEGAAGPPPKVTRVIIFYRSGFVISTTPHRLYRYDDPANRDSLALINSGHAPQDLLGVMPGQRVDVRVEKRMDEDFTPPKGDSATGFQGQGQRLGSAMASSIPAAVPSLAATESTTAGARGLSVDQSLPVTSLQIRLTDGTRMTARFNHTHTVGDIRAFIDSSRPGQQRPYTLNTAFPMKELSDPETQLASAGLLNCVVVQRYV